MRYWDASALVPLIWKEASTKVVLGWFGDDPRVVTWALARVEVASAVERRAREGRLDRAGRRDALARADDLFADCDEVADLLGVRQRAIEILARYPLRAGDALHLAAAVMAADGRPSSLEFACLDTRLCEAAEREGFRVLS